jgi:uncharacterized protein YdhG (YjbR/CyaY superfamily)
MRRIKALFADSKPHPWIAPHESEGDFVKKGKKGSGPRRERIITVAPSPPSRSRATLRKPTTIDGYLDEVGGREKRSTLAALRRTIRSIVPESIECISYGMPAFRLEGGVVAGFAATTNGCSYFPFSGSTLATLAGDLGGYDRTKSALHFRPDKPLPVALVRKLIMARIAELGSRPSSSQAAHHARKR